MKRFVQGFFGAIAFMTRVPVPQGLQPAAGNVSSSAMFFPAVGLLVGGGAIVLHRLLSGLVPEQALVVILLVFLVAITGGLHDDALADAADGFGGGWEKDQILTIMRDSRIGSFGALAIALAVLARFVFLSKIPPQRLDTYLLAGEVSCRWTALPLAFLLPSAREQTGQGVQFAGRIGASSLIVGTIVTGITLAADLALKACWVGLVAVAVTAMTGLYYRRRLGGVTGDCMGATIQLTELAVYLAGMVVR